MINDKRIPLECNALFFESDAFAELLQRICDQRWEWKGTVLQTIAPCAVPSRGSATKCGAAAARRPAVKARRAGEDAGPAGGLATRGSGRGGVG